METQSGPAGPREEYARRVEQRRAALAACGQRHNRLGFLRVVTVAGAVAIGYASRRHGALSAGWLLVPAAAFFWLGGLLQRVLNDHSRLSRAIAFYERALARIDGRWAGTGESGARFLDAHHLYADDLDLFGDGFAVPTAFERPHAHGRGNACGVAACAVAARSALPRARRLSSRLAPRIDLREDLAVLGEDARVGVHPEALAAWGERLPLAGELLVSHWGRVLSVFGAAAIVAGLMYLSAAIGLVDSARDRRCSRCGLTSCSFSSLSARSCGASRSAPTASSKKSKSPRMTSACWRACCGGLEAERFTSPRLMALRAELDVEGRPASRRIAALNRLMELVDSRGNRIVQVLGPLLLWDLHLSYALEDWRRVSGPAHAAAG